MSIIENFAKFAEENQMAFELGVASDNLTNTAGFIIAGTHTNHQGLAYFLEDEGIIMLWIKVKSVDLDEEEALEIVNDLNKTTKLGHFVYDYDNDSINVKLSQMIRGNEEQRTKQVSEVILQAGVMADQSYTML